MTRPRRSARVVRRAWIPAAAIGFAYIAQLPTALRLDTDSTSYLQIAASIADGNGAHPEGVPAFPVGYPALLAGLDLAGLETPWAFVLLNLAFLTLAITSLWAVLRIGLELSETEAAIACLLTLLSSLVVKHAVMPLSEVVFLALVAASLALLTLARRDGATLLLCGGIGVALGACSVRTAGIALAPAIVLALRSRRSRLTGAVALVLAGLIVAVATPRYLDELADGWDARPLTSLARELRDLLELLGAGAGNVPESRADDLSAFLLAGGALAFVAIIVVLYGRRERLGPVDGWVAGTLVLLFAWPSDSVRFMLPLLPFLIGYGVLLSRRWRAPALGYAALFALAGVVAIALSTRLTYSGDQFPERYAGGELAPTYRVAWGIERASDADGVDARVLQMLRRYDPRSARATSISAVKSSRLGP